MQKILNTLKEWSSIRPKKDRGPYASVMERTIAWAVDLTLLYYLLRDLFDRVALMVFNHHDIATIDEVKRNNFYQIMRDGEVAAQTGNWGQVIGSPAMNLYLTDLVAEFFLLGLLVVGAQCLFGNTPGKWLMGLKIVRRTSLKPIAKWRYPLRYLAYIPSVGFFMVGLVFCHFNRERRALHDMMVGTVVVQTRGEGWYWGKVKQGYGWARSKLRQPSNDN